MSDDYDVWPVVQDEMWHERMLVHADTYAASCYKVYGIDRLRCEIDFIAGATRARAECAEQIEELQRALVESMRVTQNLMDAVKDGYRKL